MVLHNVYSIAYKIVPPQFHKLIKYKTRVPWSGNVQRLLRSREEGNVSELRTGSILDTVFINLYFSATENIS